MAKKKKKSLVCDIYYSATNAPPISEPTRPAVNTFWAREVAVEVYWSSGPYKPPDCPGEGANPPPPLMVEAAVGRITVVVGVEEVVALPVELEVTVEFEVDIVCVATKVLPPNTNVERDVRTASDCEEDGDDDADDDETEFVEF